MSGIGVLVTWFVVPEDSTTNVVADLIIWTFAAAGISGVIGTIAGIQVRDRRALESLPRPAAIKRSRTLGQARLVAGSCFSRGLLRLHDGR